MREMRLADPVEGADGAGADPAGASRAGGVAKRLASVVRRLAARAGEGAAAVDLLAAGEVLAPLARRCDDNLEQFLTAIALGAEADALDPRADAITLLTLHAAKGLEFSVVFLAGCERGLLPLRLPGARPAQATGTDPATGRTGERTGKGTDPATGKDRGTDLAEERRLLFVGMTRARTHLFLTCATCRRRHGTVLAAGPSPFLATISPALLSGPAPTRRRHPPDRQLRLL